jgi:hypothetical protein
MRTYGKEFHARTLAREALYNDQLELRDSLLCRAASEMVSRAVDNALGSVRNSCNPCSTDILVPAELPPVVAEQLPSVVAERLLTVEAVDHETTWPIDQVVAELSAAAHGRSQNLPWQQMTGEKTYSPIFSEEDDTSGGACYMTDVSLSEPGPGTDSCPPLPDGVAGHLVCAVEHPLPGFSSGGALTRALVGGPSAEGSQDDSPTTDGELEACIGICDVGRCADGCKCSLKLKRKRPMARAPVADLADGTFNIRTRALGYCFFA